MYYVSLHHVKRKITLKHTLMKSIMVYKTDGWFFRKYKKNLKMFSGISKEQFEAAKEKHFERWTRANREELHQRDKYRRRREIIRYFAEIPYEYEGDGLDDYNKYQRPCNDGIGYVSVCPGERANNFYVDDPLTVAYLMKKYNKYTNS